MVMVVAGFYLENRSQARRFHTPQQPHPGECVHHVVDRLGRYRAQSVSSSGSDGFDVSMRSVCEFGKHRDARPGYS
jgi:hypothetical protein